MKSKELKAYNLPGEDLLISRIDAKPNLIFTLFIILGILSFFFNISFFYGAALILLSINAMIFMPKVTLIEFFQDYFVIYNKADKNRCVMIYYDEVSSWYYSWSTNRDYLYIELEDGSIERIEAFSKTLFESNMNRFLKDKKKAK